MNSPQDAGGFDGNYFDDVYEMKQVNQISSKSNSKLAPKAELLVSDLKKSPPLNSPDN
jgi:hypothetical protein